MRKLFLGLAVCLGGLALTGAAEAHPYGHGHGHGHAYYHSHAVRFRGGYYYRGVHHHWTRRVWDARCHRWNYWDPGLEMYYYYYAPGDCYYPVDYTP